MEQATSAALAGPYEEVLSVARRANALNVDETSWQERRGARAWLWTAATTGLSVFWIDPERSGSAFQRFLVGFRGRLITDRWRAYFRHPRELRQICWSHLLRDFEKLALFGSAASELGRHLLKETELVFELWHAFKRGEFGRAELRRRFLPLKACWHELLLDNMLNEHPKARALCSDLLTVWPCMWLFVKAEGVEPTNNTAERALRPAVLWRKGSFGSQSERGSNYAARMLTVVGTLRKQNRHVLDFLVKAVIAYRTRAAPPSIMNQ